MVPLLKQQQEPLIDNTDLDASDIIAKSLQIAGDIDIYTNSNVVIEELTSNK